MCQVTKIPKPKFTAIVCIKPEPHGFLINSKIGQFIQNRPESFKAQVRILASRYSFLDHDSFIDCSQLFLFKAQDLQSRESIQNDTKAEILKIVSESKMLTTMQKAQILNS